MRSNKLIAYAIDFVSFLIENIKKSDIHSVILFGSVARNEADETSDVDLFINLVEEKPTYEKEIKSILHEYYNSSKFNNYWKLLGVENEIRLTIGNLEKWKDLKANITSDGIILCGRITQTTKKGEIMVLYGWENIKPDSRRVLLNKRIFGYSHSGKKYKGLLEKLGGERFGKQTIVVPQKYSLEFKKAFKDLKIPVKIEHIIKV